MSLSVSVSLSLSSSNRPFPCPDVLSPEQIDYTQFGTWHLRRDTSKRVKTVLVAKSDVSELRIPLSVIGKYSIIIFILNYNHILIRY